MIDSEILLGDCLDILMEWPDDCIDAFVTDPPYGLGKREPSLDELVAFLRGGKLDTGGDFMDTDWEIPSVPVWQEVYRVLKPGGYVLAFGGTRAWDLISLGLRAAGFEFRDTIQWLYGQGMPKSHNVSKALGKAGMPEEAGQRDGWGTALKPSWEPILVFRKPLEGTVARNVLAHGTGAINIDACRVATAQDDVIHAKNPHTKGGFGHAGAQVYGSSHGAQVYDSRRGRWPPNTVLSHHPDCRKVGVKKVKGITGTAAGKMAGVVEGSSTYGLYTRSGQSRWKGSPEAGKRTGYVDSDGLETVEAWECVEGCPVKALDEQSGDRESGGKHVVSKASAKGYKPNAFGTESRGDEPHVMYSDSGGASRFFPQFQYVPKPSRKETTLGGRIENRHKTKKPLKLMQWLVRLVCQPGGIVVDPYCGSGTTLHAAHLEGMKYIGIDNDPEAYETAVARMAVVMEDAG